MRTTRSNGSAVFEVEGTGMGIPAGEQEHLFDRFFRGLIEATSKETAGTTFRVVFPANT